MAPARTRKPMQAHIRTLMNDHVITVGPDDSLLDAAREFAGHGIGALPVVDAKHRLVGLVSTSDLITLLRDGERLDDKRVRDVMDPDPTSIDEFGTADEAIAFMRQGPGRHLPVTREGRLVGLVAGADLIRHFLKSDSTPEPA